MMSQFFHHLILGIQSGGIYALVALGYTMVYGIIRLINFAHGDFVMIGAYISIAVIPFLSATGVPLWFCLLISLPLCAFLGAVVERLAYKPLRRSPKLSALITAIAVSILLKNLAALFFGSAPLPFPNTLDLPPINLAGISVSAVTWVTVTVSVAVMAALEIFIRKSRTGLAMRAVSENPDAAVLMGINSDRTIRSTFVIGAALASIASFFYCSSYALAEPYMGTMLGLKAFIAAVLGGTGSITGAMLGGILIGIVESFTKAYISSQLSDAVVFVILILVLLIKPSGIMGKMQREKV